MPVVDVERPVPVRPGPGRAGGVEAELHGAAVEEHLVGQVVAVEVDPLDDRLGVAAAQLEADAERERLRRRDRVEPDVEVAGAGVGLAAAERRDVGGGVEERDVADVPVAVAAGGGVQVDAGREAVHGRRAGQVVVVLDLVDVGVVDALDHLASAATCRTARSRT